MFAFLCLFNLLESVPADIEYANLRFGYTEVVDHILAQVVFKDANKDYIGPFEVEVRVTGRVNGVNGDQ